jgi:S-adenosylmethionine synthetase
VSKPLSIYVDTYGTAKSGWSDARIVSLVCKRFDLRPGAIVRQFDMKRPIFQQTACFGHFGRPDFAWEHVMPIDLSLE